jgi:hypothetical protein
MSSQYVLFNLEGKPPFPQKVEVKSLKRRLAETPEKLRQIISTHLPEVDWSDPIQGLLDAGGCDLEFNLGSEDDLTCIVLEGSGVFSDIIAELCKATGWWALDSSTGRYVDPDNPSGRGIEIYLEPVVLPPPLPSDCPKCKRQLSRKTGRCIYCG